MKTINIALSNANYNIYIEDGIKNKANSYIKRVYNKSNIFIITDSVVAKIHLMPLIDNLSKDYKIDYVIMPSGEENKNIETYSYLAQELINKGIRRGDLIIALGGGVCGDMAAFIASTLYRGLPFINIPTTLLSQMDSSIGGKTGIDFNNRKNILGTFYQPKLVLIDPSYLKTLEPKEFNNGMAELIKHGAIMDKGLLALLKEKPLINEDIIERSLLVKAKIVMEDEFDLNKRMLLNFGHTFAHSFELKKGYRHGEAVSMGMLMAIRMGIDLGITNKDAYSELEYILKLYSLPVDISDYHKYISDSRLDKKNISGTISFILLKDLGDSIIYKINEDELKELENGSNN